MRILLDECVPKRLGKLIPGHGVRTVVQEGWSGKKNGVLLGLMSAAGFEVFITVDQGIPYQQNPKSISIGVIIMIATSNDIADLMPLLDNLLVALNTIQPGDIMRVEI